MPELLVRLSGARLGAARCGHLDQALDPLLRAIRLNPSDPLASVSLRRIALVHYHLGKHEELFG
jgi:hypothetical protein